MAQDLFRLLEGGRVDHCLRREYRGLKSEIELFLQTAMGDRPAVASLPLQEAVLEAILRFTILGESVTTLPWPALRHREDLLSLLTPLLGSEATIKDSARATVILYRWLSALPNIRWDEIPSDSNQEISPLLTQPLLQPGGMEWVHPSPQGEEPYKGLAPLPHWGELRPELVQNKIRLREVRNLLHQMDLGIPLSAEALKELLERGIEWDLEISDGQDEEEFQGLFVTDLKGLKKAGAVQEAVRRAKEKLKGELRSLLEEIGEEGGIQYFYDEWDFQINDYRVKWCRLKEKEAECGSTGFVDQTLESYSALVAEVRKQFQMLKPERFKKIPHLERGEEIDLNAVIEASVDRRAGRSPSEKIYIEKNRKDRDFSTLFLLDMSASTDEWVEGKGEDKKVIDIEKEALVVMAEALEEIGDEYAIFGFSGYGRKEVDFYSIKDFREGYGDEVKGRIEKIKPQRSTRMGPAIRHAVEKMAGRESKVKNLILISDGYPQDYDYGDDRSDKEYALQDTTIALEEAARKNIHTFCITVDRAGHDYLRKMMPPSRYLIIEKTTALPRELPKIYRRLTT
jgi:nitric oxide reductase activation protein